MARWTAKRVRESWLFIAFEVIGFAAVLAALTAFVIDLWDRREERIARHWQLLATRSAGEGGKSMALEYLVSKGVSLANIDLSSVNMGGPVTISNVDLSGADFTDANLDDVMFRNVDLSFALFSRSQLNGASFIDVKVRHTSFLYADMSGVKFSAIGLESIVFDNTGLTGAKLEAAEFFKVCFTTIDPDFANSVFRPTAFDDAHVSFMNVYLSNTREEIEGGNSDDAQDGCVLPLLDRSISISSVEPVVRYRYQMQMAGGDGGSQQSDLAFNGIICRTIYDEQLERNIYEQTSNESVPPDILRARGEFAQSDWNRLTLRDCDDGQWHFFGRS